MRPALDLLAYLALLLLELLARSLPPAAAVTIARGAGRVWYLLDGRRRSRARESLRVAREGGLRAPDLERLVEDSMASLMQIPLEVLVFPRYFRTAHDVLRRCRFLGDWDAFRAEVLSGSGGLLVGGHLGSWELSVWVLRFLGAPSRVVVRPIENRWVDRHTTAARGGEARMIRKRGAVREVLQALRDGAWVGIMADQNAGPGGRFVPFFGLEASTYATPAALAVRTGVPFWAAACLRRPAPFTYEIHLRRLPPPDPELDELEAARALLEAFMVSLEGWIQRAPDQYNWVHRRWKSRPAGEVPHAGLPRYDRRSLAAASSPRP